MWTSFMKAYYAAVIITLLPVICVWPHPCHVPFRGTLLSCFAKCGFPGQEWRVPISLSSCIIHLRLWQNIAAFHLWLQLMIKWNDKAPTSSFAFSRASSSSRDWVSSSFSRSLGPWPPWASSSATLRHMRIAPTHTHARTQWNHVQHVGHDFTQKS